MNLYWYDDDDFECDDNDDEPYKYNLYINIMIKYAILKSFFQTKAVVLRHRVPHMIVQQLAVTSPVL